MQCSGLICGFGLAAAGAASHLSPELVLASEARPHLSACLGQPAIIHGVVICGFDKADEALPKKGIEVQFLI